ncbi:MAG: epoxyqueuosine reductase [Bacteroidales bacterium]|nr:epoxyqueuosine reductase [Bacteroidales bacterium]
MKENIRQMAISAGADVCGFANIDRFKDAPKGYLPTDIYKDCKSVLALGIAIPRGLSFVNPQFIYGHFNELSCPMVDQILFRVARMIEDKYGGYAIPIPSDAPVGFWDEETKTAHGLLSMKHIGVLAGIGFMGKNTILCNEQFGNQLTIGAILLTHDLPSDELSQNHCLPKCHKCIDNCPVHAIREDGTVNQKRCRENTYKTTFRNIGTVECNLCRMGCPLKFGVKTQKEYSNI